MSIVLLLLLVPARSGRADLYEDQLNRGIRNSEPYSYLLIQESKTDSGARRDLLREARRYSPDLPAVYFEMAKTAFNFTPDGVFQSVDYVLQGISAYERNFWWAFMAASTLFMSTVLSFLLSILIIILIRLPRDIPLFSHDIHEEKSNLFLLLSLIIAVFGPLYLVAALLMLISLYQKDFLGKFVIYAYILFLLLAPWTFKTVSMIFNAPASAQLKAVVQVNNSEGNEYAISQLSDSDDGVELFSYALALKREGRYGEAIDIYDRLIAARPDARLYNNLANCYAGLNDFTKAIDYYKKSIVLNRLPSTLYNLSQVYRVTLDFEQGEKYFISAQQLDSAAVSGFRLISSRNANRFVIDETLPFAVIWEYAWEKAAGNTAMGLSTLGPVFMPPAAFFVGILAFVLNRRFKNRAYRCSKCGKILCSHCEKHILWRRMCSECYSSLVKLDELDAKGRIARIFTVYEHQKRRRDFLRVLSFIVPGGCQIYAGNILYGLLFLWPFLFFILVVVMDTVFVMGMSNFSHSWLAALSLCLMAVVYLISNIITRRRLAKGWL